MSNIQWRRYLRIIANKENIANTSIQYAIRDNQGLIDPIEGTWSFLITLYDLEVEVLDEDTAREHISGANDTNIRTFDQTDLKTIYRLILGDGQRLVYVQCADCFESFVTHDSHKSFDQK